MKRETTEIRQAQIKKAVLTIISTEGLSRLSTRNLAAKVGVSEGAIFRHFKSKKDIMLSIVQDVENDLIGGQKEIVNSNLSPVDKLFKFLCRNVKYLIKYKGITILLFSEATHMNDTALKNKLFSILSEQKKLVKQIITEGKKAKVWDSQINADDVATLYMGIPITLNIEMILNKKGFKDDKFCNKMMALLTRALV